MFISQALGPTYDPARCARGPCLFPYAARAATLKVTEVVEAGAWQASSSHGPSPSVVPQPSLCRQAAACSATAVTMRLGSCVLHAPARCLQAVRAWQVTRAMACMQGDFAWSAAALPLSPHLHIVGGEPLAMPCGLAQLLLGTPRARDLSCACRLDHDTAAAPACRAVCALQGSRSARSRVRQPRQQRTGQ